MSRLHEQGLVKPEPIKDFSSERVIYFPLDAPSRPLIHTLKKTSHKEITSTFGSIYLLKDKAVLTQCIGAPLAALALETLVVSGAKEIIIIGFCGSFNPDYRMLSAVSVSRALSEEGTSKHYLPKKKIFHPSPALKNKIESRLRSSSLPFLTGSLVSTDAPFRETRSWLNKMKKKRLDLVDMEVSAVFALAEFHSIQAAALMIISDEIWSGVWKHGFNSPELEEKIKEYFFPIITLD
jgi:purine-nucleoside phosphorylase